jgi:hypothetical protein
MTDIRNSLDTLATAIENLQNAPATEPTILDRQLSGNKVHGGRITEFASKGIKDRATDYVLTISDDGVHVSVAHIETIANNVSVQGDLTVSGTVHAQRMHVEEVTADVRNERTDPLQFTAKGNNTAYGKGLLWPGGEATKQFILQERPDRFFATESIELRGNKIYMINGQNVLSQDTLGTTVVNSNIKNLGTLETLDVEGHVNIDNFVRYDANTQRLGLGTETPNGTLSIVSWDHEFIIDNEDGKFKIGTYTTGAMDLVTDDTARISISPSGNVTIHNKTVFKSQVGIGVKNFANDADLTVAGAIRFEDKKFETGEAIPETGNYKKGDIVWNSNPMSGGMVGWVCITSGKPGQWKTFGNIS